MTNHSASPDGIDPPSKKINYNSSKTSISYFYYDSYFDWCRKRYYDVYCVDWLGDTIGFTFSLLCL